jgi:uncharacterized membrane protein
MNKILIFVSFLFLLGCNYNQSKNPVSLKDQEPQKISSPDQLTYKIINQNVLAKACLDCHSASGGNRGGINLETYEKVFAVKDRIKAEVASKSMPPASKQALSDQQIKMIIDWIDAGALENGKLADEEPNQPPPTPPTPPPVVEVPVKISFAEVNEKVIKTNCTQCHSAAGGNRGGVNLETYDNVFVNRLEVKFQVENGSMPTKRGTPLTNEQKKLLLT